MGPWKYAIGAVMSFILLFSIVQNSSFSVIPDTKPQEPDSKVKFDLGFYEKVLDMINAGETREHTVIVYVKKAPMNGEDAKLVAKKNKDKLEDAMIKIHRAKNVYKAQILSFVVASVPIQEILKLAEYDFVLRIGDGELKGGPEMDVSRPTVNVSTAMLRSCYTAVHEVRMVSVASSRWSTV